MTKRNKKKLLSAIGSLIIVLLFILFGLLEPNLDKATTQLPKEQSVINLSDNSKLEILFLDVGQADSILINNNGEYALIDAGNNEDGKKLVEFFNTLGINNFKYVIGTHPHEDHIGGMDDIIKNFTIDNFFMPDVITTTKTFEEVLDALLEKNISFQTPQINSTFNLADTKFEVLYVGSNQDDLNDTSIVLKLTYGNTSYLLMGDATKKVEKELLNKNIKSDVLKVGHHGSEYSSHKEFLEKVNPQYAIIQVGKNNTYNHPKQIVLDNLTQLGAKIYRTDKLGTIVLTSDGEKIELNNKKTDTNG